MINFTTQNKCQPSLKSASNFLLYDERHFVTLDPAMKKASIAAIKP